MNQELQIIKQVIDCGVQRGIFKGPEDVEATMVAFRRLGIMASEHELMRKELNKKGDGNGRLQTGSISEAIQGNQE